MMLSVLYSAKLNQKDRRFILKEEDGAVLSDKERDDVKHINEFAKGFDSEYKNKTINSPRRTSLKYQQSLQKSSAFLSLLTIIFFVSAQ